MRSKAMSKAYFGIGDRATAREAWDLHQVSPCVFGESFSIRRDADMEIYKAVNRINGKIYVGQTTVGLKSRVNRHVWGKPENFVFSRALRKYEVSNFEFSTIDTAESIEELNQKEKFWIAFFNSKIPNGYNMTDGGFGCCGFVLSDESREKVRQSKLGKPRSEETKAKLRAAHLGMKASEETKAKLSAIRKGRALSEEHKRNLSLANKGNEKVRLCKLGLKRSPESIDRMRAAQKGRPKSEEHKEKLRQANLGKKASIESRIKMSESQKARQRKLREQENG
jgi:group I intron endonuclease